MLSWFVFACKSIPASLVSDPFRTPDPALRPPCLPRLDRLWSPRIPSPLCFHTLKNWFSRNPFILILMQNAPGVGGLKANNRQNHRTAAHHRPFDRLVQRSGWLAACLCVSFLIAFSFASPSFGRSSPPERSQDSQGSFDAAAQAAS